MVRQITSEGQLYDIILYNPERDLKAGRTDLTAPSEILQVAVFNMKETKTVKAHYHLPMERDTVGTQETLFVVKGSMTIRLYGVNNEDLGEFQLESGDAVVFLHGAHAVVLEEGSLVYEVKNGPYVSVEKDKVYINDL